MSLKILFILIYFIHISLQWNISDIPKGIDYNNITNTHEPPCCSVHPFLITLPTSPSGVTYSVIPMLVFILSSLYLMVSSCKRKHPFPLRLRHDPQILKQWALTNCLLKKWQVCFYLSNTSHVWIAKRTQLSIHHLSAPNPAFFALLSGAGAGCSNIFFFASWCNITLASRGCWEDTAEGRDLSSWFRCAASCSCSVATDLQVIQWCSLSSEFHWHPSGWLSGESHGALSTPNR